ncbi:MAG TPA: hypothetical protein VF828_02450 [Patescibacteria group bacterium]
MTKNPLINALLAALYIVVVAAILFYGTLFKVGNNAFIAPVALISLFSFSAGMMGYLFLYQPFVLYFDGSKKPALDLFLKTLFTFGGLTFLALILLFSGILR